MDDASLFWTVTDAAYANSHLNYNWSKTND